MTVQIGTIADQGSWAEHVHVEMFNYSGYSRSYEWDGPSNADDQDYDRACSRSSSPNAAGCNAQVTPTDAVGYVGGNRSSFAELNNPYYPDF